MFCGNVFLSGEHGIISADNNSKNNIYYEIGTAIDSVAANTKPMHAIFIKDFKLASLNIHDSF